MTDQETTILLAKVCHIATKIWPYMENNVTCQHMERCDLEQDTIVIYLEKYAGKCPKDVVLQAYIHNKVRQTMIDVARKYQKREELFYKNLEKML